MAHNLGENGHVVLEKNTIIKNQESLSQVYVLTPDDYEQRIAINFWYGVITPANETQVTVPEETPATVISVPYILPIFWIISLSEINPYFPALAEIGFTLAFLCCFCCPYGTENRLLAERIRLSSAVGLNSGKGRFI
ncbi:hypothetical protein [Methanosarcina barkeri]|uniref:hypothetical protein n=1 Tax=Methanosarcina barkeri TaxID=2208 RepID=UPI0006D11205|nr:hypothetical protein [Methanosarcina barkeri]